MAQDKAYGILLQLKNIFFKTEGYAKNYSESCDNHFAWMKDYLKEAEKALSKETFKKKKQNEKDGTSKKKKSKKQMKSCKVSEDELSCKVSEDELSCNKSITENTPESSILENNLQCEKENHHQELGNKMECTFSVDQSNDLERMQQMNEVSTSVLGNSDELAFTENAEVVKNKISFNYTSKVLIKSKDSKTCNVSNSANALDTTYKKLDNSHVEYIEESICENSSSELFNGNMCNNKSGEKSDLLEKPQFKPKDFENVEKENVQKGNAAVEILNNSIQSVVVDQSLTVGKISYNIKSNSIPLKKLTACDSSDENYKNISQFNHVNEYKETLIEKNSRINGMKSQMSEGNSSSVHYTPQTTGSKQLKPHIFLASAAKMSETRRRSSLMRYKIRKSKDCLKRSSYAHESHKSIDALAEKNSANEQKQNEKQTKQTPTNMDIAVDDDSSFCKTPEEVNSNKYTPLSSSQSMKSDTVPEILYNFQEKNTGKKLHQNQPFTFTSNWKKNTEKSYVSPQVFKQKDGVQSCLQSKLGSKDFNSSSYLLHSAHLRNSRLNTSLKVSRHVSKLICAPVILTSSCKRTRDTQVQRISRPGSFNMVCNVTTFLKSHNVAQESDKEKNKLEEMKKRQQKEEEIIKKRTQLLQMKVEEQKRKREERMQKNLEARQQIERAKEERIRYLEQSKEEKFTQFGKELEKRREKIKNKYRSKKNKTGLQPCEAVEIGTTQQQSKKLLNCVKENEIPNIEIPVKQVSAQHENNSEEEEERKKLNSTFTKSDKMPVSSNSSEHTFCNYDISDLKSDDESDNECAPSKPIPSWAIGIRLKEALIRQHYQPPDMDKLFGRITLPNLSVMFGEKKKRFLHRTSSAVWCTPDRPFSSSFFAE